MPIYEYQPLCIDGSFLDWSKAETRRCCFFEHLNLFNREPLEECLTCGQPVRRVPSRFCASGSSTSKTAEALRSEGLGHYAEAWEDAKRVVSSSEKEKQTPRAIHYRNASEQFAAQGDSGDRTHEDSQQSRSAAVRDVLSKHVCTAACKH